MKAGIFYVAIFTVVLFIIPILAAVPAVDGSSPETIREPAPQAVAAAEPEARDTASPAGGDEWVSTDNIQIGRTEEKSAAMSTSANGVTSFRVLDESTGVVGEISLRDFVRGAVAAEMPVSFHSEALKAQAVAAHTFALHNHYAQLKNPDPSLKGADFSADPSKMKVYITEEKAKEFYGKEYAEIYWDKIREAADSVLTYIMEYENEPIVAAYHAVSAGRTEDAANVWSGKADYLKPADSHGDYLAPDYEASAGFSEQNVKSLIQEAYPDADLSVDPGEWFSGIERSESGYITSVSIGGIEVHGKDLRMLFGLRSHNMDIYYGNEGFVFVTYGYGHGVGLSQYGADFLARQGHTFDEILANYYTGASLKRIELD